MLEKRGMVLLFVLLILFLVSCSEEQITGAVTGILATPGNINICDSLNTSGTYTLTQNVNSNGTCFSITAHHVLLDCQGFIVNYSVNGTLGYGVNNSAGFDNTTIRNCQITEGNTTTSSKYGIYFAGRAENSTINNNTITTIGTTSRGISIEESSYNITVRNNTITTTSAIGIALSGGVNSSLIQFNKLWVSGSTGDGISISSSSSYNNISSNNISVTDDEGILLSAALYNHIYFNNITTYSLGQIGVEIEGSSDHNRIYSNNISTLSTIGTGKNGIDFTGGTNNSVFSNIVETYGSSSHGIRITSASANNISFNNVTTYRTGVTVSYGIYSLSTRSEIVGNRIAINNAGDGIRIEAANNSVQSNLVNTTAGSGDGILLGVTSHNTTVADNIIDSGSDGINLFSTSEDNLLLNNNITATSFEIIDDTGSTYQSSLIYNNSFGEIVWTNLSFRQDLDVDIDNDAGLGLGRNIFIGNNTIAVNTSAVTSGFLNSSANMTLYALSLASVNFIFRVDNFTRNDSLIIADGTNCVGTSCSVFNSSVNTLQFNATSFSSFAADGCGVLTGNKTLQGNVSSSGTCFTIAVPEITLDCAGYAINYSSATTGYGINNSDGYDAITIKNCGITHVNSSSYGIYFGNVSNSTIRNNTINGSLYGLMLSSSDTNTIENNTIIGIHLQSLSFDNLLLNNSIIAVNYSIFDESTGNNTLMYNNTFGQINWTKSNLTTNITLVMNNTIFILDNLVGLTDDSQSLNLDGSAEVVIKDVSISGSACLFKSGVECSDCTVAYNSTSQILTATVSSFSNYTSDSCPVTATESSSSGSSSGGGSSVCGDHVCSSGEACAPEGVNQNFGPCNLDCGVCPIVVVEEEQSMDVVEDPVSVKTEPESVPERGSVPLAGQAVSVGLEGEILTENRILLVFLVALGVVFLFILLEHLVMWRRKIRRKKKLLRKREELMRRIEKLK